MMQSPISKAKKLRRQGKNKEAKSILLEILNNNPGEGAGRIELAKTYSELGEYDIAIQQCYQAFENGVSKALMHETLGYIYLQQEDYEKCKKELSAALDNDPQQTMAYGLLGKMYYKLGMLEMAEINLKRGKSIAPNDYWFSYWLGVVYSTREEYNKALEESINYMLLKTSPVSIMRTILVFGNVKPHLSRVIVWLFLLIVLFIKGWYVLPIYLSLLFYGIMSYLSLKQNKHEKSFIILLAIIFVTGVYFYRLLF